MLNKVGEMFGIFPNSKKDSDDPSYTPHPAEKRTILHSWEATAEYKPKKMDEKTRKRVIIIGVTVALVFALIQEFLVIFGIASLVFGYYMLTQWEPEKMSYKITSLGIEYGDQLFGWGDLRHFFVTEQDEKRMICADTTTGLPGRLYLPVNKGEEKKFVKTLEEYLPFLEKEPQTFIDTAYKSVFGKIKLDR